MALEYTPDFESANVCHNTVFRAELTEVFTARPMGRLQTVVWMPQARAVLTSEALF